MPYPALNARGRRLIGAGAIVATLVGASLVALSQSADAAVPGQYAVGTTAVQLNQPADPSLGKITPAADANTVGMYDTQVAWPLIPVHATLLANGHLVSYGTPLGQAQQGGLSYDDWNPARGTVTAAHSQTPSMDTYNSFCNSLQTLPDGRLVMVGGNSSMSTMFYDPTTKAESMGAALNKQRWYATTMRLPDDRILVLGGADYYNTGAFQTPDDNTKVATTPEIGSGTGAWTSLTGATSTTAFGARDNRWWYPRGFNAPDGKVFGISANQMWRLDPSGTGAVTDLGTLPASLGVSGAAVMYAPGKLLLAGGGQQANYDSIQATNAATLVDISGTTPAVTATAPMANRRNWVNLTVLPNGEVLANGGTVVGTNAGAANAAYANEIWNPTTKTWRTAASAKRIRTYHSSSVLMPSGGVFTGGGGVPGPEDNLNAELYYPPNLFTKGADGVVKWASRPQITTIAGNAVWGGQITLGMSDNRAISSASLINLATVTHSVNTDQRRVPLTITQNGATVSAAMPTKAVLPPGSYLLTTVDSNGVPSASQTITIGNGVPGRVTVYEPDQDGGTGGGGTSGPGVAALTPGTAVGLEPVNFAGYRVRQANFTARIDPATAASTAVVRSDSSFIVRAGLDGGSGISFESVNYPGYFLRVVNGVVKLVQKDGTAAFNGPATFLPVTGLTGQNTSLKVASAPTTYLRHQNYVLNAQPLADNDGFRKDATFTVRPALQPLAVSARVSLESADTPGSFLRHGNYVLRLDPLGTASSAAARQDGTVVVRAPLSGQGCVSLESVNFPGYFLKLENGGVALRKNDGTAAFGTASTFCPVTGLGGAGVTLRTSSDGTPVITHSGATVTVGTPAATAAGASAATYAVKPPLAP